MIANWGDGSDRCEIADFVEEGKLESQKKNPQVLTTQPCRLHKLAPRGKGAEQYNYEDMIPLMLVNTTEQIIY